MRITDTRWPHETTQEARRSRVDGGSGRFRKSGETDLARSSNETLALPYFLRDYRDAGIERSSSSDKRLRARTVEYMAGATRLHVFQDAGLIRRLAGGIRWLNAVSTCLAQSIGCVVVDDDECCLPHSESGWASRGVRFPRRGEGSEALHLMRHVTTMRRSRSMPPASGKRNAVHRECPLFDNDDRLGSGSTIRFRRPLCRHSRDRGDRGGRGSRKFARAAGGPACWPGWKSRLLVGVVATLYKRGLRRA